MSILELCGESEGAYPKDSYSLGYWVEAALKIKLECDIIFLGKKYSFGYAETAYKLMTSAMGRSISFFVLKGVCV